MEQAPANTVVPFDRSQPDKGQYEQAVQLWCQTRGVAGALSKEEIGAMAWKERMDAQRKALIVGFAHYLREHPRADVALGVYLVTTLFSDNDKGTATISQPTLAKLFRRSVSSIGDAQRRLKDDGLIVTGRGRYAGTYPVIPRFATTTYNHMTWLVSALCDVDETPNLPAPPVDCQSTGQTGGLKLGENQSTGQTGWLGSVNQPVEGVSINRPDRLLLLSKNSKKETTLDSARDVRTLTKALAIGIASAAGTLPAAAVPTDPPAIIQPAKPSLSELTDRMMDAAGAALANPVAYAGLLTYSELQRWLTNGCDFDGDILPAIRARCARASPGSIKSWRYFDEAVAHEKAARERPMAAAPTQNERSDAPPWKQKERARLDAFFKL